MAKKHGGTDETEDEAVNGVANFMNKNIAEKCVMNTCTCTVHNTTSSIQVCVCKRNMQNLICVLRNTKSSIIRLDTMIIWSVRKVISRRRVISRVLFGIWSAPGGLHY